MNILEVENIKFGINWKMVSGKRVNWKYRESLLDAKVSVEKVKCYLCVWFSRRGGVGGRLG